MKRFNATGQRLTALFMAGCVLLNYPILSLFTGSGDVAGIPLLFAYVFGVWVLLVVLLALVIEQPRG
jgi:hypothetical protein